MRYMYLITSDPRQGPPPQALMDAMGELLMSDHTQRHLVSTAGLTPLFMGARVATKGGKTVVLDGPFAESKEVVGGYAIFDYPTREDAVDSAVRFMELHTKHWPAWEGVCEMREIVG